MKIFTLITLIFIITLIPIQSNAQTETKQVNFDSLVKANNRYVKEDITKLKMLNQLAKGYPNINPVKGIETGELAIALAQKLSNQLLLAEAYNNTGLNYMSKGEFSSAMELYNKAQGINQKLKNTYGIAENTYNIGGIYGRKGEIQKAIEQIERALHFYESINSKAGMAKAFNGLGVMHQNISEFSKALEFYQKARIINEQLGNMYGMASNLLNSGNVYMYLANYPKALEYYQKSLTTFEQMGNKSSVAVASNNCGSVYLSLSDHLKALEYFQKALVINEQLGAKNNITLNLGNIGSTYMRLTDSECKDLGLSLAEKYSKALVYFQKALHLSEQLGFKYEEAANLAAIGQLYKELTDYRIGLIPADRYSEALDHLKKALAICEQIGYQIGMADNLFNIGSLYLYAQDTVLIKWGIEPSQRYIKALEFLNRSLALASDIGALSQQKIAWEVISINYEKQGDFAKAYDAYKKYIVLRDSIESDEIKGKIERKTMQFEFDKKETAFKFEQQLTQEKLIQSRQEAALSKQALTLSNKEKDLQRLAFLQTQAELHEQEILSDKQIALNQKKDAELQLLGKAKDLKETELQLSKAEVQSKSQQRNGFIFGSLLLFFLAGAILIGLRKTANEKKKSEDLLLNILPAEVADELKNNGESVARQYNNVSVLFTDFVNFTGISEGLSPTELVQEIHKNFTAFDTIMEKHRIEKIKTIGDAYLAVCGMPIEVEDHAQRITRAALEIQEYVQKSGGKFQMRIGINSGPVVAGIVGVKKFAYDIWGDTVNTASRMESAGEVGKVNISQSTYDLIKDSDSLPTGGRFEFESRGKIEAKGKGEVEMWFVQRSS